MPYHLQKAAGVDYKKWHKLKEPEQVIFDLRIDDQKRTALLNQSTHTFKQNVDLWQ